MIKPHLQLANCPQSQSICFNYPTVIETFPKHVLNIEQSKLFCFEKNVKFLDLA